MFNNLGWGEILVLLVLALFLFGPDRLPGMARDAGRTLRKLRTQLRGMTDDLKAELGPDLGDLDLRSLHPRAIMADLMREQDPEPPGLVPPQRAVSPPLAAGEPAPFDPDTT